MSFWKRWSANANPDENASKIKSMNAELTLLHREINRLTDLNKDLDSQVRELHKGKPMNEQQLAEIAAVRKDNDEMRRDQNMIVVYLRGRFPNDFAGRHAGRTFGEMVVHYLSRILFDGETCEAPRATAKPS